MPASVLFIGPKQRSKLDFLFEGLAKNQQQRQEAVALQQALQGVTPVATPATTPGAAPTAASTAEVTTPAEPDISTPESRLEKSITDRAQRIARLKEQANRVLLSPGISQEAKQRALQAINLQFENESRQQALEEKLFEIDAKKQKGQAEVDKQKAIATLTDQLPPTSDPKEVFDTLMGAGVPLEDSLKVAKFYKRDSQGNSKAITLNNQVNNILSRMKTRVSNIEKQISVQDRLGNIVLDFLGNEGKKAKKQINDITQSSFKAIERLYQKEGLEVPSDIMSALKDFQASNELEAQEKEAEAKAKGEQDLQELDEIFGGTSGGLFESDGGLFNRLFGD